MIMRPPRDIKLAIYKSNVPLNSDKPQQLLTIRQIVTNLSETPYMLDIENGITMKLVKLSTTGRRACRGQRRTTRLSGTDRPRSF